MSKAIRTTLSLVVSLVLFSALTMAQPGGNNANKDKNKEHHSRFAKVAFWRHHWRHHKDADKNAKQAQATQAPSKQAQAKFPLGVRIATTHLFDSAIGIFLPTPSHSEHTPQSPDPFAG